MTLDIDSPLSLGVCGSPLCFGRLATSEKKKDVLTVGVRLGVCFVEQFGVLSMEPKPGLKSPFAVGD